MRNRSAIQTRGGSERGYALLIVMFLLTLLVLMTITVAPNAITDAQREKETEMIWRGKQYVRGIKRYYMKTHRFPLEMDDLTKPKTGIRFMRQAYKDPMNPVDGAWRLIYVGPNGQLIGSLKPQTQNPGGLGTPVSSMASSSSGFGSSSFGGSSSSSGILPLVDPLLVLVLGIRHLEVRHRVLVTLRLAIPLRVLAIPRSETRPSVAEVRSIRRTAQTDSETIREVTLGSRTLLAIAQIVREACLGRSQPAL